MSVSSKIQTIMKTVGYMQKDGKISGSGPNYSYLSEEQITAELHRAFAEVGLTITPHSMAVVGERDDVTRSGGVLHNIRVAATYQFTDPDDKDTVLVQVLGEGSDSGDKAVNKAMTGAYKYALRQSFMISTGDDPDHTASQETVPVAKNNSNQALVIAKQMLGETIKAMGLDKEAYLAIQTEALGRTPKDLKDFNLLIDALNTRKESK